MFEGRKNKFVDEGTGNVGPDRKKKINNKCLGTGLVDVNCPACSKQYRVRRDLVFSGKHYPDIANQLCNDCIINKCRTRAKNLTLFQRIYKKITSLFSKN